MNRLKTMMLLAALTALVLVFGQALGGQMGLKVALVLAFLMNFVSYWFSDKIVLAMYRAEEVTEAQAPEYYGIVRELAQSIGMPMPRVYVIPDESPNAFATGRSPEKAAVAATVGLLRLMDRRELAGVMAHELGHVQNRDTLIMTVAAALAGALSHLAQMAMWGAMLGGGRHDDDRGNPIAALVGVIVAPFAAMLIQMAISRSREFGADEAAARTTGDPLALASALRKLEGWKTRIPMQVGSPATAHMMIVNPFTGAGLASLFSTHPATEARIERLEALARGGIRPY